MHPPRGEPPDWRRLEALVEGALELPPDRRDAYLEREASDPALLAEARELVRHGSADPGFLTRMRDLLVAPLLRDAIDRIEGGPPDPVPGDVLADRYRIDARLEGGSMGAVYRGTDTVLDRSVALKLLPARPRVEATERGRFAREARAASALDHPNIGIVHDIFETAGGRLCIVMAFYEGRSLADALRDGPLDVPTLCDVGLQVARGLAAAHDGGILHCDVKPGNVLLTPDGTAKIVDFGLARFLEAPGEEPYAAGGTLPYMSPEQLRGEPLGRGTDIWSLGATLHEMAVGHPPFGQGDRQEVATRILGDDPPSPREHRAELPAWLDELVMAALRRRRADRPPDMTEVCRVLEEGRTGALEADGGGRARSRRRSRGLIAGAFVVALSTVAVILARPEPGPPAFGRPRQLSSAEGVEDFAVWSPDGRALLYQAGAGALFGGKPDVMLLPVDGRSEARSLTDDHPGFDGHPSWSPDGSRYAFYSARDGGGYFVGDLGGGPPRKVWSGALPGGGHNRAEWSPDGSTLAVTVDGVPSGASLQLISAEDGSLLRSVLLPGRPGNRRFGAAWSPDGRFVAVADAINITPDESRLWLVRVADGRAFPLTGGQDLAWSPMWGPDGRSLFFVSDRSGSRDLWMQPIDDQGRPRGEAREITTGVGMRNAALSRDGTRLVYSRGRLVAHVWSVPIPDTGTVDWTRARQITTDRAYVEFVESDVRRGTVLVSSDRGGNQDLWMLDPSGARPPRRLTDDPAPDWAPALSPDGRRVAFYSARSGNREVWIRDLDGGPAVRVTRHPGVDFVPSWSPDGRQLAFASGRSGNLDVWVVEPTGRGLRRLTTDPAMDAWPHWSPDGSTVVFRSNRDGRWRLWSIPASGGTATRVTDAPTTFFRWSPDGSALFLVSGNQLRRHDPGTGEERPLTSFGERQGSLGVVALATDGRRLFFTWEEDVGDLWMMERRR